MTRKTISLSLALAWTVAGLFAVLGWHRVSAADNTAKAKSGKVEAPHFEVDPSWPKIPNGWTFGQVSTVAADPDGNIWVLQRPKSVQRGKTTGPPVMEFDQDGNYLQGWGGPGTGYDWPATEHGIFVDYKGFVWICGNARDDQILKFTKDGKFVMQIGKGGHPKTNADTENLYEPADLFVYAKTNELFVADGYGNHRVIVFDADTGKFKRMWGAYGNVPMDDPPKGPAPTAEERRAEEATRTLATQFDPKDPGPQQFDNVHSVKVSNDGFVYVSDRGGKRVQVFTTEGKYLTQAWIDRWCLTAGNGCGNGYTAASTAFSADPAQRFIYISARSPARIWVYDRKTLTPLEMFGSAGIAPGEFDVLHHMTTDTKGNLYTSEVEDGRRVQKFVFKGLYQIPQSKIPGVYWTDEVGFPLSAIK